MKKEKSMKMITVITIICALIAFVSMFFSFLLPLCLSFMLNRNASDIASVGIIGGADGPTAIFLAGQAPTNLIAVIFTILALIGIIYLAITKISKK